MKKFCAASERIRQHTTMRIWCLRLFFIPFLVMLGFSFYPCDIQAQEEHSEGQRPSTITVSLGIIDIPKIDEPMETFDIDSYLYLEWNDPAIYEYISGRQMLPTQPIYEFYSTSEVQAILKEIGWPEIVQFTNQVGGREILSSYLWIESDGSITYYERFQGTFHSTYDLRKYPFDSQKLNILIEAAYYDKTMVQFEASKENIFFFETPTKPLADYEAFELEEWYLAQDIECYVGEYVSKKTARSFSYVSIDINAQRKIGFHIWKIFLPLILIIAISWSVFWIWTENVGNRLSISMIGFLTAISFGFFISRNQPMISYLTLMDIFIIGIYIFMTLTVIVILTTHLLAGQGKELIAARLNFFSRWLFPISFLFYLIVTALIMS